MRHPTILDPFLAAAVLAASVGGCADSGGIEDARDASLAEGKSDGSGFGDGTLAARLVLRLASEASMTELVDDVGLSSTVANAIIDARHDGPFASLAALDAVPSVGDTVVHALRTTAAARWVPDAPAGCQDPQWVVEDLGPGSEPSVSLARTGRIDVALENGGTSDYAIASHPGGDSGWTRHTLERDLCAYPAKLALGVDAAGARHLACTVGYSVSIITNGNAEARWQWRMIYDRAAWNADSPIIRTGQGYPFVGFDAPQLVIDGDGRVHVLFGRTEHYSTSTHLSYVQHAADHGAFRNEDLPIAVGEYGSIEYISGLRATRLGERDVAVVFRAARNDDAATREVRYASSRGDDKGVYSTRYSLGEAAVGFTGEPVIVFERVVNDGIPILSQRNLSDDPDSLLDIVGGYVGENGVGDPNVTARAPAMTTTPDGTMHLVFHDGDTSIVHATRHEGSDWSFDVIGSLPSFSNPSITQQDGSGLLAVAAESDGNVVIARQLCP